MPWDARRLTPAELVELFEGRQWQRSRDIEVFATGMMHLLSLVYSGLGGKDSPYDFDAILAAMPNYDGERFKQTGWNPNKAVRKRR